MNKQPVSKPFILRMTDAYMKDSGVEKKVDDIMGTASKYAGDIKALVAHAFLAGLCNSVSPEEMKAWEA